MKNKHTFWLLILAWIVIVIISTSCRATYRTEPYKPSMNPAKEYQKRYKSDWPEYKNE